MNSFLIKVLLSSGLWCSSVAGIAIWKLKDFSKTKLVFGNYQDYISPKVASELKKKYNATLDYFENDSNLKEKFEKKIYDLSIASTPVIDELIKNKSIKEINWSKFDEEFGSGNKHISTYRDAWTLFSDPTHSILSSNLDFLKYGIPYFLSKFSFYYTGPKISELTSAVNFSELVEIISKEPRFRSENNIPKLAIVDDSRTLLSFARLVNGKSINISKYEYENSEHVFNDYKSLLDKGLNSSNLGKNFLLLSANSSTIVDSLAASSVKGAFMYNGDGFFAASGGNLDVEFKPNEFHTVELKENLMALDFLVLSKDLSSEQELIAYKLAKDLLITGHDSPNILVKENEEEKLCSEETETKVEDDEVDYKYMTVRNFDFVQYTPTLKNLEKAIFCKNNFFKKDDSLACLKRSILKIKKIDNNKSRFSKDYIDARNFYEQSISSDIKNNVILAYEKFKSFL